MICPNCGEETRVVDSRKVGDDVVWRRRECKRCRYRFNTEERMVEECLSEE